MTYHNPDIPGFHPDPSVCRVGTEHFLVTSIEAVVGAAPRPGGPVVVTVETGPDPYGPDSVSLGFDDSSGTRQTLVRLDGRYLSTEVTGGFLGRMIGMYAVGGEAAFESFDHGDA